MGAAEVRAPPEEPSMSVMLATNRGGLVPGLSTKGLIWSVVGGIRRVQSGQDSVRAFYGAQYRHEVPLWNRLRACYRQRQLMVSESERNRCMERGLCAVVPL